MALAADRVEHANVRGYEGQWVAIKDGKVLFAARTPQEVVRWTKDQGITPDLIYRVLAKGEPTNFVY